MMMAAKKGPGPGGGDSAGKAEAEAASEVWCRRVRELGGSSQAGNRHCFECAQRGVTYVDITVGSFVCTSCSGLLRGLNPPHRVKSISMTTFTEPEVMFLQSRGNEVCRKIWLGLFDSQTSLVPDSRDPQKVKEFLQEKYEKKRWYVPPDQIKGPSYTKSSTSTPTQDSTPDVKPLRTLLGDPVPSVAISSASQSVPQARLSQHPCSQPPTLPPVKKASTDLLADIGGDPFAAPQPASNFAVFGGQGTSHGGFANFDAFGSSPFSSTIGCIPPAGQTLFQTQPTPIGSSQVTPFGASPLAPAGQPSALSDMSNVLGTGMSAGGVPSRAFGTVGHVSGLHPAASGSNSSSSSSSSTGLGFGAFTNPFITPAPHPQLPSTNPFQTNGVASGLGLGMNTVVPSFSSAPTPGGFPGTFSPNLFPPQTLLVQQQNGSGFVGLGAAKLGQRPVNHPAGISTNPFMTGSSSSPFASKPPPTNPFL
ncbi:arf-GAP domain and FG repeat-containing protein 2 isoform X2 [Phascolarctos cinereus]|uniref:Arf-GAP domain and FG repeat-containing protein 2 isoform X3 n=1 Tax=Phascolarctos cinereus TaxID=38626 RepID=A0A6P5JTN8_PHACI|nr:arf-GAP domain and FG repeat-containing protein 2 isoform X3 [Phascolarctos cinereus]